MDNSEITFPQKPKVSQARSFASLRSIFALMLREMSTTYGRSPGGYVWAVAEPVAGITFLTIVFSMLFNSPPIGYSFALFYATGMLPFGMFSDTQQRVMHSLMYSKPLLGYPTVTFVDAILARTLLSFLTNLLNAVLVAGGAILLFEGPIRVNYIEVLHGFLLACLLGLGVGTLNCYITMKLPVWQQAWSLLMRPMFVLSGVMMLYTQIPLVYRDYFWWNPIVHVIGVTRGGFYEGYDASYTSSLYVILVSLACLALGLSLLHRRYRDLLASN